MTMLDSTEAQPSSMGSAIGDRTQPIGLTGNSSRSADNFRPAAQQVFED